MRNNAASGAIIISDLHGHNWPRFATTLPDGTNSRFADLINVLDQVEDFIVERKPRYLIIEGDLTHRRYYVQFSVYTVLMAWIIRMREIHGVIVICLVGNHDIESEGVHSLGPLALAGICVVDRPQALDLDDFGPQWFVPYMSGNRIPDFFHATGVPYRKDQFVFLHYCLDGKILSNEFAVPSPLKKSDLDGFEKIFFGHIHSPSVEDDGRIVYVGAPLHFDFGDVGKRYAWYLHPSGVVEACPLRFPPFITATYPKLPVPPLETSGFLRVLDTPRQMFADVKKAALESGWRDVMPVEQRVPDEAIKAITSATVMVSDEMVREYVASQYPDVSEATRREIVEQGLDYLRIADEMQ
jgi:DNA repair exonuclease SbcCD nuclease subunit